MATDYDAITKENLGKYGTEIDRIGKMLLANRYSDRTHFVYELLQNAEDALRWREGKDAFKRSVQFDLEPDSLMFSHNGLPFQEKHVRAICGIGESTKEGELTAIGHFGIGFKSVYAFTGKPEVHSEDEHFVIESYVRPKAIPAPKASPGQTAFRIPFSDARAYPEILKRLQLLGHRTLLFLKNIESVEWKAPGGLGGTFLRDTKLLGDGTRKITLLGESNGQTDDEPEQWLVFSRNVYTPDGEPAGQVEIAFELFEEEEGRDCVIDVTDSSLVVFFPTEKETNLGFLVQGPYKTTPSRDNIPKDDEWNQYLIEETAVLVSDSLLRLRTMGLLSVDALQAMPLDSGKFKPSFFSSQPEHMFRPIFDAVKSSLREEKLIPKHKGGHVSAKCAKIARTEALRGLIESAQLTELYNSDVELSWVSEEITRDKTPLLRTYLMKELEVAEVDADSLPPLFTGKFLTGQSDEWLSRFYAFLHNQPSLWRSGGFRNVPIIRLENGQHTVPFDKNDVPNAFLPSKTKSGFNTVKQSICDSLEARKFLETLGLTIPDPVDDVIVNVLPQFKSKSERDFKIPDYEKAIARILDASDTNLNSQRSKLEYALRGSSFVRAMNAGSKHLEFRLPADVYFPSEKFVTVFEGTRNIWFVDTSLDVLKGERARRLLEAVGVRDYLRKFECVSSLDPGVLAELRREKGASQYTWTQTSDFDVAGLAEALKRIGTLKPVQAQNTAAALWSILADTLREAREPYFKGTYTWGYNRGSWDGAFPAKFLRDLTSTAWIPDSNGKLRRPTEIRFSDVTPSIKEQPNTILQYLLQFQPDVIQQLAAEAGIDLASIELLKKHGLSSEQLLQILQKAGLEQEDIPQPTGQTETPPENEGQSANTQTEPDVADAIKAMLGPGLNVPPAATPDEGPETSSAFGASGRTGSGIGGGSGHTGIGRGSYGGGGHGSSGGSGSHAGGNSTGNASRQFISYIGAHSEEDEPDPDGLEQSERIALEESAITLIISNDPQLLRTPVNNPGFDLVENDGNGHPVRWVEVKAMKGSFKSRPVGLSKKQFETAQEHGDKYWLYVVELAGSPDAARIIRIQDPAGKARTFTFDHGWLNVAETDASDQ